MVNLFSLLNSNRHLIKNDVLSGITVSLALIPEAIAFAFVAGVTPLLSLQTAIMMVLIATAFTGRPGMITSSTAAVAVVLAPLVMEHGLEYLFATVILMGIIQLLMSLFKLGKYTRIIPHPVVLGFLNGLAIVIFISQFEQFKVKETVMVDGVETIHHSWLPGMDLGIMLGFVVLTMAIIHYLPKVTKAVPSALAGIGIVTVISAWLSYMDLYHLRTVADFAGMNLTGTLPTFYLPHFEITAESLQIIVPYAIVAALVGITESTLTLRVIDEMTNTRGKMNKEYFAQGIANFTNGFFGGMGGCAMIGQSIINTKSGGRTRLSGFVAGAGLLIFLLFFSPVVNAIPLASLVGLMFMVVISTFKWETLKYKDKIPAQDILVIAAVSIITVFQDLGTAVIAGIFLSAILFAWEKSKHIEAEIKTSKNNEKVYKINGTLFFGSSMKFKELFHPDSDPDSVVIDLKYTKVVDSSAIEAINNISLKYENLGKKCVITRADEQCRKLLKNAEPITSIKVDTSYDPTW